MNHSLRVAAFALRCLAADLFRPLINRKEPS